MKRVLLLSIITSSALFSAEEDFVETRDFTLHFGRPLTLLDGVLEYFPYSFTELGFDNNISRLDKDTESDVFLEVLLGAKIKYWFSESHKFATNLYGSYVFHTNKKAVDVTTWDGRLSLLSSIDSWKSDVSIFSKRVYEPTAAINRNTERINSGIDGKVFFNHHNGKMVFETGYSRVDYTKATTLLTASVTNVFAKNDRNRNVFFSSLSYKGDKSNLSSLGFKTKIQSILYDTSGSEYKDSTCFQFFGTFEKEFTENLKMDLSAGVGVRYYTDDFDSDTSYDDKKIISPLLEASLTLEQSENLVFKASLDSGIYENDTSNYVRNTTIGLSSDMKFTESISAKAFVDYIMIEASGSASGVEKKKTGTFDIKTECTYYFNKSTAARLHLNYMVQDAKSGEVDFEVFLAKVDFAIAF